MTPPVDTSQPIIVEGTWHTNSKTKTGVPFHDVSGPKHIVEVKDVESQGEWESRRLWKVVAEGIRKGDHEAASKDKTRIEVRFIIHCSLALDLS